jgi:hypothetical protein
LLCGDDLEQQADEVDTNFASTNKERDYVKDPTTEIAFHSVALLAVYAFFDRRIPVTMVFGWCGKQFNKFMVKM